MIPAQDPKQQEILEYWNAGIGEDVIYSLGLFEN